MLFLHYRMKEAILQRQAQATFSYISLFTKNDDHENHLNYESSRSQSNMEIDITHIKDIG